LQDAKKQTPIIPEACLEFTLYLGAILVSDDLNFEVAHPNWLGVFIGQRDFRYELARFETVAEKPRPTLV
jgi:hypothetical protein